MKLPSVKDCGVSGPVGNDFKMNNGAFSGRGYAKISRLRNPSAPIWVDLHHFVCLIFSIRQFYLVWILRIIVNKIKKKKKNDVESILPLQISEKNGGGLSNNLRNREHLKCHELPLECDLDFSIYHI